MLNDLFCHWNLYYDHFVRFLLKIRSKTRMPLFNSIRYSFVCQFHLRFRISMVTFTGMETEYTWYNRIYNNQVHIEEEYEKTILS